MPANEAGVTYSDVAEPSKTPTESTEVVVEQWALDLFDPIAREAGFVDYTVVPSSGSKAGDGFMGIMLRVHIRGVRNGRQDELSLMLKMPPTNKARRIQFQSAVMFERESLVYRTILPMYVDFQKAKGLTTDDPDGFFRFPRCYAIVTDREQDRYAIVMEDLKAQGYDMFDKFKVIDMNHVRLVVTDMAKLHAVSMALRDQKPAEFEPFTKLKDLFLEYLMKARQETMMGFQRLIFGKAIDALGEDETELRRKIGELRDGFMDHMEDCVRLTEDKQPRSVVNHGDCWNNNMMYYYANGVSME